MCLAARQRVRDATDAEMADTDVVEEPQPVVDLFRMRPARSNRGP